MPKPRKPHPLASVIAYAKGENHDPDRVGDYIRSLSEVVVSSHYGQYKTLREELVSVGIAKALDLLLSPLMDFRRNVRCYLYTGIRNAVSNYLRKELRIISWDPQTTSFGSVPPRDNDGILGVDYQSQQDLITKRLEICGILDGRYRGEAQNAALYRALL